MIGKVKHNTFIKIRPIGLLRREDAGSFQAKCTCGWVGVSRNRRAESENDEMEHRIAANG